MTKAERTLKFQELREKYYIYEIDENQLCLVGGGDFYDNADDGPDDETREEAQRIAEECEMEIIDAYGEWQGWSEYTPDPGNVSVFRWEPAK